MSGIPATEYMDSLVRDYLKFRGFNNTIKTLEADLKADKDKGFRVDRIMQHILAFVNSYDLESLRSYWTYFNQRFFCRYGRQHEATVKRLETNLYRLYIIHALQSSKPKEVIDFFDKMSTSLQHLPEWKEWFVVPFIQSPESNPMFALYFSRQWAETFLVSLHNFLSSMFSFMPEPDLVTACIDDGAQIQKLEKENHKLRRLRQRESPVVSSDDGTSTTYTGSCASSNPKYIEAKGLPGTLAESIPTTLSETKRNVILGFVTRQSSTSTSPKASSQLQKQSSRGSEGNTVAIGNNKLAKKPPLKDATVVKQSSLVAQRKELMSVTKKASVTTKASNVTTATTSLNQNAQRPVIPDPKLIAASHLSQVGQEQLMTPDSPMLTSTEIASQAAPMTSDMPLVTSSSDDENFANGDLILYQNTISLTQSQPQVTTATHVTSSSRSAVDEFVASYDFVSNLHRMSMGQLPDLDSSKDANGGNASNWNFNTNFASVMKPVDVRAEEPFLVLSKDVYLEHHSGIIQCGFDITGTTVASIDTQGVVKVWQNEPHISTLATVMLHSPIQCFEWCSNPSDILFLGTSNGAIRFFETTSSITLENVSVAEVYPLVTSIATHPSGTSFVCSCVRPSEGGRVVTSANHGILLIWSVRGSQVKLSHTIRKRGTSCETTCMEYNHNGNLLVAGDFRGSITLYDMKTYEALHSYDAHSGYVSSICFSLDETLIFSLGADGQFLAWNVHQPGNRPLKFSFTPVSIGISSAFHMKDRVVHRGKMFCLDPSGKHVLMACGNKGIVYYINTVDETLCQVLSLPEHKSPVTSVDWTSNKTCGHCLTGSSDGKVQVTTLLMQ